MRVGIDGRLAHRAGGTGVRSYGSTLAETVRDLGHDVELLMEGQVGSRWSVWRAAARPGAWPVPLSNDGQRVAGDVFRAAQVRFDLRGSLLTLRAADPPALMHWTYPLPMRVERVPNFYTVHDLIPLTDPELSPVPRQRMTRLLRRVVDAASHVVTVSEASRRAIIDLLGVAPDRVTNTYQAVTDAPPDDPALVRALEQVGLAPGTYLLHAGSVERRKNVAGLIQAHRQSRTALKLVIAGPDGWGAAAQLAGAGPDVIRLPWVPRPLLVALIAGARLVAMPSLAEGFGLPVAEAMTLGTPTICSRGGALEEIAGGAAILVDPRDPAELAAAIADLDRDAGRRDAMRAAGLRRAGLFTPAAHTARLRPLYAAAAQR